MPVAGIAAGAVLVLCSVGLLGSSGVALWAQTNRHGGYADLATATYSVPVYAIASDTIGLHLATGAVSDLIGTVRIQVTQASGTAPAFVGIAPAGAAARYLAGVDYATVRGAAGHHGTYTEHAVPAFMKVRAAVPRPALIIAGGSVADEPIAARWFQTASPATVQVWVVPHAGHTQGLSTAPRAWEAHVISFLNAALKP